jgi:hypothetical protein
MDEAEALRRLYPNGIPPEKYAVLATEIDVARRLLEAPPTPPPEAWAPPPPRRKAAAELVPLLHKALMESRGALTALQIAQALQCSVDRVPELVATSAAQGTVLEVHEGKHPKNGTARQTLYALPRPGIFSWSTLYGSKTAKFPEPFVERIYALLLSGPKLLKEMQDATKETETNVRLCLGVLELRGYRLHFDRMVSPRGGQYKRFWAERPLAVINGAGGAHHVDRN